MLLNEKLPTCFKCKSILQIEPFQKVTRSEECNQCYSDIRCCNMCEHFCDKSYNQCREPSAQRITDKDKANFCDYYLLGFSNTIKDQTNSALDLANSLFKD